MKPNRTKDQERMTMGKNPPNDPREKQREEKSTAKPDEQTKRPLEDKKGKPAGQKYDPQPGRQPAEDENPLQDPGFEPDALEPKPGR